MKEENPISMVIPLYLDIGLWSNELVDGIVVKTHVIDVLPLSTWPIIPILIFGISSIDKPFISFILSFLKTYSIITNYNLKENKNNKQKIYK